MNRTIVLAVSVLLVALLAGCAPKTQQSTATSTPASTSSSTPEAATSSSGITIAMIPKVEGMDYFRACRKGAEEAAKALGVKLIYRGPSENKVERQIELIDGFITQGVNVIAVSPNDPVAIAPELRKARAKGIHVLTFDADAQKNAREFFVDQCTPKSVGYALVDEMAAQVGPDAPVAIVTGSLTAANQNEWIKYMKERMAAKYPKMKIVVTKPSQEDQQLAFQVTQDLLKAYPSVKGIFGITSAAFPGAADAVEQAGESGKIAVVGLSTPKDMKPYVKSGTVKTVILWNPVDLGYLTIEAAKAVADGTLKPGATELDAGRLGKVKVEGDEIILGKPAKFTAANIDNFNF